MELKDIKQLGVDVYKKRIPTEYARHEKDFEGALREEFRKLAPDINAFRRNKLDIYEIIQDVVDEVAPARVQEKIGMFADIQQFSQGQKARFRVKRGRAGVKRFVTKVGLGGVFERVRLDSDFVDVETHAYGATGYIELEQFLDGSMDWNDLINLIIDGIEYQIYKEIYLAVTGTYSRLPAANKHTHNAFSDTNMVRIITTVKAYGGNATIIAPPEFAATIIAADKFIGDNEKADIRNQGYVGRFYGADVVVLPQSFEDETNTTKVFNPTWAVVIPTGGDANEKIVKVAFEGQTIVEDSKNPDGSKEFTGYKKLGTTVLNTNYYGLYENTSLV